MALGVLVNEPGVTAVSWAVVAQDADPELLSDYAASEGKGGIQFVSED